MAKLARCHSKRKDACTCKHAVATTVAAVVSENCPYYNRHTWFKVVPITACIDCEAYERKEAAYAHT